MDCMKQNLRPETLSLVFCFLPYSIPSFVYQWSSDARGSFLEENESARTEPPRGWPHAGFFETSALAFLMLPKGFKVHLQPKFSPHFPIFLKLHVVMQKQVRPLETVEWAFDDGFSHRCTDGRICHLVISGTYGTVSKTVIKRYIQAK